MTYSRYYIGLIFLAFFSLTSVAQSLDIPHISVAGNAEKEIVPNQLHWNLTVKNKGKILSDVASEHTKIVNKLIAVLKEKNIPKKEIQTTRMQFSESWQYLDRKQVLDGYFASTNINFTLEDLDQYQGIWQALSNIPSVSVNNVSLDHTDKKNIENEIRKSALLNARDKAEKLAAVLGNKLGGALSIQESGTQIPTPHFQQVQMMRAGAESDSAGGISLGTLTISASISATFRLED